VVGMTIITKSGQLETLSKDDLVAFGCAVGMIGIIYSITIQCVDAFLLEINEGRR
jgi:hypothetical protein